MAGLTNQHRWTALKGLTVASMKMYFRNRTAVFFSLFFPIIFITIFGLAFKSNGASLKIDLVNQSNSVLSKQFTHALSQISAFKITDTNQTTASSDLNQGNADLVVIVPSDFGKTIAPESSGSKIIAHYNAGNPQNGQTGVLILGQLADNINDELTHTPQVVSVVSSGVQTRNLSYIDFLLPGMVALSIMQLGIFSVAFAFVTYKSTGMLRRIQATPTHPANFLIAQGSTRILMGIVQSALLVYIGLAFFGFHLQPQSWLPFLLVALLGSGVFMALGYAIAGWAKNEDQAQPIATLIQFPMLFLSGTFFSRASFPPLLHTITNFLPLTFLADALRQIANQGVGLWAVRGDLLGLAIWGIGLGLLAVRVFSWE